MTSGRSVDSRERGFLWDLQTFKILVSRVQVHPFQRLLSHLCSSSGTFSPGVVVIDIDVKGHWGVEGNGKLFLS